MTYEDLKGKRVLVTGSSSGIGAAAAVMFAQQGCFVGVHYFATKEGGEKTLAAVKEHSDGILLHADMRDKEQVGRMIEQFAEAAGRLDDSAARLDALIKSYDGQVPADAPELSEISGRLKETFDDYTRAEEALWKQLGVP